MAALLLVGAAMAGLVLAEARLRGSQRLTNRSVLGVALVLRILLLPLPPTLSDDVHRYVWDGRVLLAGFNPYRLAPEDPELVPLRDEQWQLLPHRDVPTVYPPLAQALFSIAASAPGPVLLIKALLAVVDLGSCWLVLTLARRWRLPAGAALWYAWNPLVTVEIAGMGHVDGLGVAAALLATYLLAGPTRRPVAAAAAAAAAVLAKLVPAVALPIWARQGGRPMQFLIAALAMTAACLLPLAITTGGPPPGLVEYGVSWEFNGPLFEPLWRSLDRLEIPSAVHAGLDRLKNRTGAHGFFNRLYPWNYPQFLAKLLLAAGLLITLICAWRLQDPLRSLRRAFGAVIVFSATVYPWYALWVLPWAALSRHVAWLALSGLLFLSYLPQHADATLYPGLFLLIWLPFLALLPASRRWSTR